MPWGLRESGFREPYLLIWTFNLQRYTHSGNIEAAPVDIGDIEILRLDAIIRRRKRKGSTLENTRFMCALLHRTFVRLQE